MYTLGLILFILTLIGTGIQMEKTEDEFGLVGILIINLILAYYIFRTLSLWG